MVTEKELLVDCMINKVNYLIKETGKIRTVFNNGNPKTVNKANCLVNSIENELGAVADILTNFAKTEECHG